MLTYHGPVYIVDDEPEVRDSMQYMLESFGYEVFTYESAQRFLDTVDISQFGCLILDSRMPNMRGQELHEKLNQNHSPLAVIFLTGHGDVPMAVDAFKEGAVDFFQKPVDGETITAAIDKALIYSEQQTSSQIYKQKFDSLTGREQEVLQLLANGFKNQQMADKLHVALRTIEVHRSNIMKKLDCANVAELMLHYSAFIKAL